MTSKVRQILRKEQRLVVLVGLFGLSLFTFWLVAETSGLNYWIGLE